jgi:hypothetical protein
MHEGLGEKARPHHVRIRRRAVSSRCVVKPVIKGQPLNVALLGVGVVSLVLGIATWRKSGDGSGPPSA